jgi:hypothetical protein
MRCLSDDAIVSAKRRTSPMHDNVRAQATSITQSMFSLMAV